MHQESFSQMGMFHRNDCNHDGTKSIKIGGHDIYLGGTRDLKTIPTNIDLVVSLNGDLPRSVEFGRRVEIICAALKDYGGVPDCWDEFINQMATELRSGRKILAYCMGGHGRTGCFGASLISVMEPDVKDPVREIRDRHCREAVESWAQIRAVFDLRGTPPPPHYVAPAPPKPAPPPVVTNYRSSFTSPDDDELLRQDDWIEHGFAAPTPKKKRRFSDSELKIVMYLSNKSDNERMNVLLNLGVKTGDFTLFELFEAGKLFPVTSQQKPTYKPPTS